MRSYTPGSAFMASDETVREDSPSGRVKTENGSVATRKRLMIHAGSAAVDKTFLINPQYDTAQVL